MRTIEIEVPRKNQGVRNVVVPVVVDWFPSLTEDQILANAVALFHRKPCPFPDPNLIEIVVEYR